MPAEEGYSNSATLSLLRDAAQRQQAEEEHLGDILSQGEAAKWGAIGNIAPNALKNYAAGKQFASQQQLAEDQHAQAQQNLQRGEDAHAESMQRQQAGNLSLSEEQLKYDQAKQEQQRLNSPIPAGAVGPDGKPLPQGKTWAQARQEAGYASDIANPTLQAQQGAATLAATKTQTEGLRQQINQQGATFEIAGRQNRLKTALTGTVDADGNPRNGADPMTKGLAVLQQDVAAGKISPQQAKDMVNAEIVNQQQVASEWRAHTGAQDTVDPAFAAFGNVKAGLDTKLGALNQATGSLQQYTSQNYIPFMDSQNSAAARDNIVNTLRDSMGQPDLAQDVKGWDFLSKSDNIKKTLDTAYGRVKSQYQNSLAGLKPQYRNNPEVLQSIEQLRQAGLQHGDPMASDAKSFQNYMLGNSHSITGNSQKTPQALVDQNPPPGTPGAASAAVVGANQQPAPQPAGINPIPTDPTYYQKLAKPAVGGQ